MSVPTETCESLAEDISLHAAGEPSAAVERHLAECTACRARHTELLALCGALEALPELELPSRWQWRRAAWPLGIAASLLLALWPSAPRTLLSTATIATTSAEPPPAPTWLAYSRALGEGEPALDALLDRHAAAAERGLPILSASSLLTSLDF